MADFVDDIIETVQADDQEAAVERVRLHVGRGGVGKRVDKYVVGRFRKWSRTTIQRMIEEGAITVNDKLSKPSYALKDKDVVELVFPAPESAEIVPEPIPLDILFEDDAIIVLNKQAGIVCHPARPSQTGTIANALTYHSRDLSNVGDPARPGIVHRLDKNTTGVLITAKQDEAHFRLGWQFERRTIGKTCRWPSTR
jgi:23S rRNA pseudouridine1911/1915/1917 synthase